MISPTDDRWRAVRLRDSQSVGYLNRLFAEGWHLMRIDADGLPYLGFEVPVEPPPWTTPKSVHTKVDADRLPRIVMIVLRRGDEPDLQRAVYVERDETGHFDLGAIELGGTEWGHFAGIAMEDVRRLGSRSTITG
jgi:hypothetical protein